MDEIRWVVTPKCSACVPDDSFRRRISCIGCEKLLHRPALHKPKTAMRPIVTAQERLKRHAAIARLHAGGCSYGEIARALGLPRSTVSTVICKEKNQARLYEAVKTVRRGRIDSHDRPDAEKVRTEEGLVCQN